MESSKTAKKEKNFHKAEFNYYQDLDQRIDTLMEELRAVRNIKPRPPAHASEQKSMTMDSHPSKDE